MKRDRFTFIVGHEAWYWSVDDARLHCTAEVTIAREALTVDGDHDGVVWEFNLRWYAFQNASTGIRLEMFDDAWPAIREIPELIGRITALDKPDPADVISVLLHSGFVDVTARENPYARASR